MLYQQFKANQMKNLSKTVEVSGTPPLTLANSKGKNLKDYKVYGNSVQNGTPTPSNPVEVQSVGEKTKNLFDNQILLDYGFAKDGDEYRRVGSFKQTIWTNTEGYNGQFAFTVTGKISLQYISFRITYTDGTKTRVGLSNTEYITRQAITDSGKVVSYIDTDTSGNPEIWLKNIQIEKGTSVTSYEPYGYKVPIVVSKDGNSTTTNIYLNEPLRGIGNAFDYIDFENKKRINVIRKQIFNGTETWYKYTNGASNVYYLSDSLYEKTSNALCNTFSYLQSGWDNPLNTGTFSMHLTLRRVYFNDYTISNIEDWKNFLANSNTILYSHSSEPTEESITLPDILTQKGTNIVSVGTTINPSNMMVKYVK